ncbi:hypothetical protein VMF7928_00872 [Vibrio marisflavi CECT 7928]|uniref:Uncharacterized protein n=1 Tax=Vibrio marisflavi CECT 7928 TaxID=634439 RepID=A0ABN8E0W8_9VIBR|nr:hypothetical protein VMF7928_00872 [Vibrio marisflavi CECT 7928]
MHIDALITDALVQTYTTGRYGKARYMKPIQTSSKSDKQQTNSSSLSSKRR